MVRCTVVQSKEKLKQIRQYSLGL